MMVRVDPQPALSRNWERIFLLHIIFEETEPGDFQLVQPTIDPPNLDPTLER